MSIEQLNEFQSQNQSINLFLEEKFDVEQTLNECIRESNIFTEAELDDQKIKGAIQQVKDNERQKNGDLALKKRQPSQKEEVVTLKQKSRDPKFKEQEKTENAALKAELQVAINELKKKSVLVVASNDTALEANAKKDIAASLMSFEKNLDNNVKLLREKRQLEISDVKIKPLDFVLNSITSHTVIFDKDLNTAKVKRELKEELKAQVNSPQYPVAVDNPYTDSIAQLKVYVFNLEHPSSNLVSEVKQVFFRENGQNLQTAKNMLLILENQEHFSPKRLQEEIKIQQQASKRFSGSHKQESLGKILKQVLDEAEARIEPNADRSAPAP